MTTWVWNHTDSPYAVATLSAPGALLATAEALGTENVQFTWDWQAADGSGNMTGWPLIEPIGRQLRILQGEETRQGLLTLFASRFGLETEELVLMILAKGYGSASDDDPPSGERRAGHGQP